MSTILNVTKWFIKRADKSAATYTFGPFNVEDLNGSQFFLKYTNAVNTTVNVRASLFEANGRDNDGVDPFAHANNYETLAALTIGDNSAEGFFDPPAVFDRPFKSFEVDIIVAGTIADCVFGLGCNGVG